MEHPPEVWSIPPVTPCIVVKPLNINLNVYIQILCKTFLQIYTSMQTLTFFLTVMCVIFKNPYIFNSFNTVGSPPPRVAVYVKWSGSLDYHHPHTLTHMQTNKHSHTHTHSHTHSHTYTLTHSLTHMQTNKHTHICTQNDLRITNKSNHIPLGKSCGLTNSRKNSCATVAFSASEVEEANQNWRVRLSWVCFPVCADTRNTRNSSESCAGLLSSSTNIEYKKM